MKVAILGYGIEGKAAEAYFKKHHHQTKVFSDFEEADIPSFKLEDFDLVLRSPSVHPQYILKPANRGDSTNWQTSTEYFFKHCPAPIIGVTGTKGKGTTSSLIANILKSTGKTVHLVGNIGVPALSSLDKISKDDVVVYELSSFQLWDMQTSPHIAVVLRIETDHLDHHPNFEDYVAAKANITKHQSSADYCIYYQNNPESKRIAKFSPGTSLAYPLNSHRPQLEKILDHLKLMGAHNRENAEAAILAAAAFLGKSLDQLFENPDLIAAFQTGLSSFQGLPHRVQFVRKLNQVDYYDDNYSSAFPALDVALQAFSNRPLVLIAVGKDKNHGLNIAEIRQRIFSTPNLKQAILIGENKSLLAKNIDPKLYQFADTLENAVFLARQTAEQYQNSVVLMSPAAASFDMFKNFKDRGEQFQNIVNNLR